MIWLNNTFNNGIGFKCQEFIKIQQTCFVTFIIKYQRNVITNLVKSAYQCYFGFPVEEREKNRFPKITVGQKLR